MSNTKVVIKVARTTPVPALSGSIINFFEEGAEIELRAMGAPSINQLFKAVASARKVISTKGYDLVIVPGFSSIEDDRGSVNKATGKKEKTVLIARLRFL